MHELAVCQGLLRQVEAIAREHGADRVTRIVVRIGPLSGVEPDLLAGAFPLAAGDTRAAAAELIIERLPVRVRCNTCGAETEAPPNRLLCGACGHGHTQLVGGDEMLLASVELERNTHAAERW